MYSQQAYYVAELAEKYPFINFSKNRIEISGDSTSYKSFFKKFDTLLRTGTGKIKIVHLGGSHIQADMYTQQLRRRFEDFQPGISGDRGFIFPYKIAQTNNPRNYSVSYTGTWTARKNVDKNDTCMLGMAGISVITKELNSSVSIKLNNDPELYYTFNRLKIFHPNYSSEFKIHINSPVRCVEQVHNHKREFTEFLFDTYIDSVEVVFEKTDSTQNNFELQGFLFENDSFSGITYNTLGVNGARIESFSRCKLFDIQLKELNPDLVILSFGTNDGYTLRFDKEVFRNDYTKLINIISNVAPDASILITVPNDSYMYRKYANKNTEEIKNVIFDIARVEGFFVWDFYNIMGGMGSSALWYEKGLMNSDRIHFNKEGYIVKGDLLFSALISAWEDYQKKYFE